MQSTTLGKGLPNLGNTCYIASTLQCLRYSKAFVFQLREHNTISDKPLMKYFVELLYSGASKHILNAFVQTLAAMNPEFRLLRQCDAHELYQYLIDTFYSDNSKYKNPFQGSLQSTIECSVCQNHSVTKAPFISLSLEMGNSVKEMLDTFCSIEELSDPIECESCGKKQESAKILQIVEAPNLLVLHIKRFNGLTKDNTSVEINNTIIVHKQVYKLIAMINHTGGTTGGHYTAACKRKNGTWMMCNDNFVTELNGLPKTSPLPYVLFYSI